MQENNFEKQVQQKMDDLMLSPSGEVWKKLQLELEKKRDKKRGWFFFILIVICLAGGGSIWLSQHQTTTTNDKNDMIHNSTAFNDSLAISKSQPGINKINNRINTQSESEKLIHQNKVDAKPVVSNKTEPSLVSKTLLTKEFNAKPVSGTENIERINKHQKFSRKAAAKTTINVTNAEIEIVLSEDFPIEIQKEFASFSLLEIENRKDISPSINITKDLKKGLPLFNGKADAQDLISKEKSGKSSSGKNKNLSFLISFGIGQSATASNYLGATANRSYYDLASSIGTSGGIPGTGNLRSNIPSSIKPATGFYVGFFGAKKITQKSSLQIGLQYQLTTTSIGVGQAIVAADGSKAFATGNSNSYSNKYHFIQIPIEFSSQLSHFKKHNLYFNAGVSLSQLLHTNALQFNNTASQYFISNDYFNKTIVGLSAGFSINILKDNEAPLLLGPSFSYSLTPLAGKGLYDNSHYGFLGIRLLKVLKNK
jgi:hypothetical protein